MDDATQSNLKEFFKMCYERLEAGEKMYGDRFAELDLPKEIEQELADISNYAFLQYVKVQRLKSKIDKLESEKRAA